jgi:mannose-6-phosphate isomerase-like protein (cupin superfamily)
MIVRKAEVPPIHFGQLVIHDYTQGRESSSSLATIHVPPGADHPRAWSTRSDKYYYVLGGHVRFSLGRDDYDLMPGDFCFVGPGRAFLVREPELRVRDAAAGAHAELRFERRGDGSLTTPTPAGGVNAEAARRPL